MQHKCIVEVIDKKCFADYQARYLAPSQAGQCSFYEIGDRFVFENYGGEDTFSTMGCGTQCSEAWDCISKYVYTAVNGGSIKGNRTKDERVIIACCSDGTRPVIFRITRRDYKALYITGAVTDKDHGAIAERLKTFGQVEDVVRREDKGFTEIYLRSELSDYVIVEAVRKAGNFCAERIE